MLATVLYQTTFVKCHYNLQFSLVVFATECRYGPLPGTRHRTLCTRAAFPSDDGRIKIPVA
jgi:hypothetical protein